MKRFSIVFSVGILLALANGARAVELTDFWGTALDTCTAVADRDDVQNGHQGRKQFHLDYRYHQAGDFSIRYTPSKASPVRCVGFQVPQEFPGIKLTDKHTLHVRIRTAAALQDAQLVLVRVDGVAWRRPLMALKQDHWYDFELPFSAFIAENNATPEDAQFIGLYLEAPQPFNANIWLDDVYFFDTAGAVLGITEDAVKNRMFWAALTRQKRATGAFERIRTKGLREGLKEYLGKLYLGRDLKAVNQELYEILTTDDEEVRYQTRLADHWCLVTNQLLYRVYYMFGSKGTYAPGRLEPRTEKALLEELWERTKHKNDIYLTEHSTWWMVGSENHDLVARASNLITSQIFMNEPEFAERIYPNLGKGDGDGYWFYHMYAAGEEPGPAGRANMKVAGEAYTAEDHYRAWVEYMKRYIRDRVDRGFFLEVAAPGYMQVTVSKLYDIYDLCDDPELVALTKEFLDLIWTDWAQDQISGVRGGAKTRVPDFLRYDDSMRRFACFEFGGPLADTGGNEWIPLVTSYRFPGYVWRLALDRDTFGCYEFVARKPGEEQDIWPRPAGYERSMLCDTDSRLLRYSWVTPDYILGCQMDHPTALHSHLSVASRGQGVTFAGDDGARVFPCQVDEEDGKWKIGKHAYFRCLQDREVMICQQNRRWNQANPTWFPCPDMYNLPVGVYFGKNLDQVQEQDGWIFVEKNNAYVAVRVVQGDSHSEFVVGQSRIEGDLYEKPLVDTYEWNDERTMVKCNDIYAAIIFEAGRRADYPTLADFQADVLSNRIKLQRTVVPGWYVVVYEGGGAADKTYTFNAANNEIPRVNDVPIDYAPDFVFRSPFLNSAYKSGQVEIKVLDQDISMDFKADSATALKDYTNAEPLSFIKVSDCGGHFVREDSGATFRPWGFNYDHDEAGRLIEDYWTEQWPVVVEDFEEMKSYGANVVRVHLQLHRFMNSANETNAEALEQLGRLVELAEQTRLYLDITGLACYIKDNVPQWYDELSEQERWRTQARFWSAVAQVCADSPAVFCYDLMNEPIIGDAQKGWLPGDGLGGKHFVQSITLDLQGRSREAVAKAWVDTLVDAIRKHDTRHLVTVGVIPWAHVWPNVKPLFHGPEVGEKLDFVAVHFYPKADQNEKALKALAVYNVGKPLIIEEMFPLKCGIEQMDAFIDSSAECADGWITFYWGKKLNEYSTSDFADAVKKAWLLYFIDKTPKIAALGL